MLRASLISSSTRLTPQRQKAEGSKKIFTVLPSREMISTDEIAVLELVLRNPTRDQQNKNEYLMSGAIPDLKTGKHVPNYQIE